MWGPPSQHRCDIRYTDTVTHFSYASLSGQGEHVFKLRLGALIPRSVGRSVGRLVGPPKITKKLQNFTKHYKTLQNITKCYKTLQNIGKHQS